jgi:hypothetical protein
VNGRSRMRAAVYARGASLALRTRARRRTARRRSLAGMVSAVESLEEAVRENRDLNRRLETQVSHLERLLS